MLFRVLILAFFLTAGCSSKLDDGGFPRFEYGAELEGTENVLKYDSVAVTQKEFFDRFPEFRAFSEELLAVQTAVAMATLNREGKLGKEVQISGASREAVLMALQRINVPIKQHNIAFKDSLGKNLISSKGKTYEVYSMPLNDMELARMQTSYYLKGQIAAETILIEKMLSKSEKKILSEDLKISNEEMKEYFSTQKVDPKAMGLNGVQRIKNGLLEQKKKQVFKDYMDRNIYKKPIQSRWKKPEFHFETLPEKPIYVGEGKFKLIVLSPYDCRNCIEWNHRMGEFMTKGVEIKYYPVVTDDNRQNGFYFYQSVLCLSEQHSDVLWFLLSQFKSAPTRAQLDAKVQEHIQSSKLYEKKYTDCMSEKKYERQIQHYQKFAQGLSIRNYPIVIAGGFVFNGAINAADVKHALDVENAHFTYKWKNWFKKKF